MKNVKNEVFLTIEEAFDNALEDLKGKSQEKEKRSKIYVWRQRFKEGNLSHKKIAAILQDAGLHKVVEERWMPIDPKVLKEALMPNLSVSKERKERKKVPVLRTEKITISLSKPRRKKILEAFPKEVNIRQMIKLE